MAAAQLGSERERELRKEGNELPSWVKLREGPIGVRITLGQSTLGSLILARLCTTYMS